MNIKELLKVSNKFLKKNLKRECEDIDYKQMQEISKTTNAILIDVRSKQEYKEQHFDGALNIPLDEIAKQINQIIKQKEQIIIVYCQYGSRSKKAQNILKKLGYKNVYNLKGGIDEKN